MEYNNLGVDILGIFLIVIFAIFVFVKNKKDESKKTFLILLILASGFLLTDMGRIVFSGAESKTIIVYIANILYYLFSLLLIFVFLLNLIMMSKKGKVVLIVSFVVLMADVILFIVNIFVPIYFSVADGVCVKLPLFFINNLFYAYFILTCLVYDLLSKGLNKNMQILYIFYCLIFILSSLLSFAIPQSLTMNMAVVVCIVILFSGAYLERGDIIQKQRVDIQNAQIELMLSQIKPHFIYNALTAIQMIDGNPPETKEAIGDFAKYLRANLTNFNERGINTFKQELEIVETYLRIEKLRFGEDLRTKFNIETENFSLPNMCLQVIVENAVREHAIIYKKSKRKDVKHVL